MRVIDRFKDVNGQPVLIVVGNVFGVVVSDAAKQPEAESKGGRYLDVISPGGATVTIHEPAGDSFASWLERLEDK